jgi:hypothetical protein
LSIKAFLDTTVLADALLKGEPHRSAARAAIARYEHCALSGYAIKEFKAGPLRHYVWFHNKVVTSPTWEDAVRAIPSVRRQANKMATALQALSDFSGSLSKKLPKNLAVQYPGKSLGDIQKKEAAIWLKLKILQAWRHRQKLVSERIAPLSCYAEVDPTIDKNGLIYDKPVLCGAADCCLRAHFTAQPSVVEKLLLACDLLPDKPETTKRRQVLRQLYRLPKRPMAESDCRNLGDAVFAFQCPKDAVILTTNIADHAILASACGVTAVPP